ncbi:hypothetical protein DQ04_00851180 [Trypanosoma grayi]|uniref:hypothetical protein n=1 Tax=Trypanosoma grayi TaxID=71804 RepID=UPI0004F3FAD6|nr:hypothetical protein DQ04_00851180 [Trypanosoma grayi]KEG13692.1 hypothetical protein DQ04_00851180 [Trypanosoma grayi]
MEGALFNALPPGSEEAAALEASQVEALARLSALRGELEELLTRSAVLRKDYEDLVPRCRRTVRAIGDELGLLEKRVAECHGRALDLQTSSRGDT